MNAQQQKIIEVESLNFAWSAASEPTLAIESFAVERGEHVFLHGASGSGKTTLLSLIAAVLIPQKGQVTIDGVGLHTLGNAQRDQFRVDRIGMVFQQFNLLPFLSVAENVQLSCRFSASRRARACEAGLSLDQQSDRLLEAMQLSAAQIRNRPAATLSVGQQQRVAVARALIGRPPLIIADEPTSSLDNDAKYAFLDLLFSEVQAAGSTLLFVSHDDSLASAFERKVDLLKINLAACSTKKDVVSR